MKNGWIGRSLPRLFQEVGMTDISVSFQIVTLTYGFLDWLLGGHVGRLVSTGELSQQDAELWWGHLAEANEKGTFLYGLTAVVVAGTKP